MLSVPRSDLDWHKSGQASVAVQRCFEEPAGTSFQPGWDGDDDDGDDSDDDGNNDSNEDGSDCIEWCFEEPRTSFQPGWDPPDRHPLIDPTAL